MKKILFLLLIIPVFAFSQNTLEAKIKTLENENQILKLKIENLELKFQKLLEDFNKIKITQNQNVNSKNNTNKDIVETKSKPKIKSSSVRCAATTKAGSQCKRNAKTGSSYCWQHG
jgi:pyruvate/2-oxoglutarate dehydrogenase complex dihydrolipoamide dehydrogenase (E3) component